MKKENAMNIDLENGICPVCKAKLFTDDVAFCPDCGAPHHKKCFNNLGHCFYVDTHGTKSQWQYEKVPYPESNNKDNNDNNNYVKCPNCGYLNENNDKVCKKCGTHLKEEPKPNEPSQNPFFKANGLNPNEDIGGVNIKETASFVGYNALRYIKVFKRMKEKNSKVSWNWLGFFFTEYWYISRKMYAPAILRSILTILSSVCLRIISNDANVENILNANPILLNWFLVLSTISLGFNIITGIFGDYFYKNHAISKIKALKDESNPSEIDYMRAGGTNIFLPIVLYFGIEMLVTLILMFL